MSEQSTKLGVSPNVERSGLIEKAFAVEIAPDAEREPGEREVRAFRLGKRTPGRAGSAR